MSATFEDLRILQAAEAIADAIWKQVTQWDEFARDVVGKQLEAKFWLNRARTRDLMTSSEAREYTDQLTGLARQLNTFASGLKSVRAEQKIHSRTIRESTPEYVAVDQDEFSDPLFSDDDFSLLSA